MHFRINLIVLFHFIASLSLFSQSSGDSKKIDSLKNFIKNTQSDSLKIVALISWDDLIYFSDPELDQRIQERIVQIASKNISHSHLSNSSRGFFNLKLSISLQTLGDIHKTKGNYPQALKYNYQALKIAEKIHDLTGISILYNQIGVVNMYQRNFSEAKKNYLAALRIMVKQKDLIGQSSTYNNLGMMFQELKQYNRALTYYLNSLEIQQKLKNKHGEAVITNNLGNIYSLKKEYAIAKGYFERALKLKMEINEKDLALIFNNLGLVAFNEGKFAEARIYYFKAIENSKASGNKKALRDGYFEISKLDSAQTNYKGAYESYKLFTIYRDSILNEENTKKSVQEQMKFEFEKKEAAAKADQDKKDAIVNSERHRQQIILIFVSLFLLFALVFAIIIFRSLRTTKKQKSLIEQQKAVVEEQKHLVEEKQKEIIDSIRYAKRIQMALLPKEKYIEKSIKNRQ